MILNYLTPSALWDCVSASRDLLELLCRARSKIGEDRSGPRALKRDEAFEHGFIAVNPAVICCRHAVAITFLPEIIAADEPFLLVVRPKDVGLENRAFKSKETIMRKFNLKTITMAAVVAAAAVPVAAVTPAAAFPKMFPPHPGGGWGHGWGHHGWGWGHHGWGWGGGYYGGDYGGCYLKRYVNESGGVVVSKVCY
jgi:hypothetical protein